MEPSTRRVFADPNLFLRYLTNDVPEQADDVEALLDRAARGEIEMVSTGLVLAEIVWTLERYYGLGKDAIRDHVLAILNTPGLQIGESDILLQAAVWYAEKHVDFIDAYHAAWMLAAGLVDACTFDQRHFQRFEHLNAVSPASLA